MSGQPRRRLPGPADEPAADPGPGANALTPPDPPGPAEGAAAATPGEGAGRSRRRRRRRRKPTSAAAAGGGAKTNPQPKPAAKRQPRQPTKAELAARATSTRKEVSSGGVVYRRTQDGGLEILLAARRTLKGNIAWGLAKGHIEEGESPEDAATREVREETGWDAEIEASLGLTKYFYVWENVRIRKTVHFFLMRATQGDPGDRDDEMEEIRWFPLDRALKRAAYRGERDVLLRAADLLG